MFSPGRCVKSSVRLFNQPRIDRVPRVMSKTPKKKGTMFGPQAYSSELHFDEVVLRNRRKKLHKYCS